MRNFEDVLETYKRSFISAFSICMTVPLISKSSDEEWKWSDKKVHLSSNDSGSYSEFLLCYCPTHSEQSGLQWGLIDQWRSDWSYAIEIKTGKNQVHTQIDARTGLGTQSRYEAPSDLWVEKCKNAVINVRWEKVSPR